MHCLFNKVQVLIDFELQKHVQQYLWALFSEHYKRKSEDEFGFKK